MSSKDNLDGTTADGGDAPDSPEILREAPTSAASRPLSDNDDLESSVCFLAPVLKTPVPEEEEKDDGNVFKEAPAASSATSPPPPASVTAALFVSGPPGHTPFPKEVSFVASSAESADKSGSASASPPPSSSAAPTPSTSSSLPPPVPFNSPSETTSASLEDALKSEARRQERSLKRRLEEKNLLDLFKTPERSAGDLGPRPRKRIAVAAAAASSSAASLPTASSSSSPAAETLRLMTREERISPYSSEESSNEKDVNRRNRVNAAMELMKKLVPGASELLDKTDAYELAAKYILFLKKRVGPEHDRDFLREFMPY